MVDQKECNSEGLGPNGGHYKIGTGHLNMGVTKLSPTSQFHVYLILFLLPSTPLLPQINQFAHSLALD